MSAQTMDEAWAPIEAAHRAAVMLETWGHLAPRKNTTYRGRVVYAVGCYDSGELNPTPLVCDFDGLDDSPWLYDALNEWLSGQDNVAGCVYEISASFRNYVFRGKRWLILNAAGGGAV